MKRFLRCTAGLGFILLLAGWASTAFALEPDQILLIVNKNAPQSIKLAEYYAKMRNIPDGRICGLSLPGSEDVTPDRFDRDVVPVVRQFLREHKLETKVTCLVTFYGVPIRVGARNSTQAEKDELARLTEELKKVQALLEPVVADAEKWAKDLDKSFAPAPGVELEALGIRAAKATQAVQGKVNSIQDLTRRQQVVNFLFSTLEKFGGRMAVVEQLNLNKMTATAPAEQQKLQDLRGQLEQVKVDLVKLQEERYDPVSREKLRILVHENLGLFNEASLLKGQIEYLTSGEEIAAFDSELSLLWVNYYSRSKWLMNPLHFSVNYNQSPPLMMVMRLDGPQEGTARDIIIASMAAERTGLNGTVVIDSRGIPVNNAEGKADGGYGGYDQSLRNLAELIRTKTKLQLVFDDKADVIPANSVKNVALYVGWYSLRNYVPSMTFVPGAVGYHVASFEMLTLHADNEHGWVVGLLNDGIAATMGPVAEPYLFAFPKADQFFPLLLTGKLTLAEVYWKTQSTISWMTCMIGDPLYNPYKNHPAIKVEDLPSELQQVFDARNEAVAPSTRPDEVR